MACGEGVRSKFTGNTCFYVYVARYRGKIFLNRNVEAVLRENEIAQARGTLPSRIPGNSTPPTTYADARVSNGFRARPKVRLNQILSKLRPSIPTGRGEPVLKIEAKALKRKRLFKSRSNGSNSSGWEFSVLVAPSVIGKLTFSYQKPLQSTGMGPIETTIEAQTARYLSAASANSLFMRSLTTQIEHLYPIAPEAGVKRE